MSNKCQLSFGFWPFDTILTLSTGTHSRKILYNRKPTVNARNVFAFVDTVRKKLYTVSKIMVVQIIFNRKTQHPYQFIIIQICLIKILSYIHEVPGVSKESLYLLSYWYARRWLGFWEFSCYGAFLGSGPRAVRARV